MSVSESSNALKLGTGALEEILCRVAPIGALGDLVPHAVDAWSIKLPDLSVLPRFAGDSTRLRICIATEDIVGPVRNGGIGTTYASLAELLAKLGHDVTILYLKGQQVEDGTIEQWIDYYAAKSVRFVPVPNYAGADRFQTGADRWLHAPYNMLKYLSDHPMDVVHVSEWRGSGYLCLLAKRQRLAFQDTLFVVKTSSPWIWNRLYGSQPLDRLDDLAKVHAERMSVEFADIVIGGSLHLIRWMASQGYRIPRDRTFVQPNVAVFDHLAELMTRRDWERGTRHPIDELVFFGRLEARKGLFTFLQAIKRLIRQGTHLPKQITFMGKPGARLMARPDQEILDYIAAETRGWSTKVEILSEFQQYDALKYLLSGNRLAVMPSMIENSSLAVYEAAICGIPFIASDSGGTPELIDAVDHASVLCEAHPIPLAVKIEEALTLGGYVARPSFDNDVNLEQWRRFHLDLGRGLRERLLRTTEVGIELASTVSICVYHADTKEALRNTLASLKEQDNPAAEVLIAIDTDEPGAQDDARLIAESLALNATIIPSFDLDAGPSFNILAAKASADFLLFLWSGSTLRPMALRALTKVAESSNAELLNFFFRVIHESEGSPKDYLSAIVFGNIAQSFFRTDVTSLPLFVRRRTFAELGGFTSDYRVLAHDHELVARAQLSGMRCETALLELGTVMAWDAEWLEAKCYDQSVAQFRAIRPQLAAAPLAMRELLLMAKGLQKAAHRPRGQKKGLVRKGQPEKSGPMDRLLAALSNEFLNGDTKKEAQAGMTSVVNLPTAASPNPSKSAPKGVPAVIQSREVAASVRKDVVAARRAAGWGAGLVKLIDELSSEAVDVAPAKTTPIGRRPRTSDPRTPVKPSARTEPRPYELLSSDGHKYSGRLLGVLDGVVYGWVLNNDSPHEVVEVEAIVEGTEDRILRADANPPTVSAPTPGVRDHGFSLPLWPKWQGLLGKPSSKNVLLKIRGTKTLIATVKASRSRHHLEEMGFDGYCEISDGNVRGWVWRPLDPHTPVDIAVFVDGRFLIRTTASEAREDLRMAGIGEGTYGFRVQIPNHLRGGTRRRVDVVVADVGVSLKRGRLTLVGRELSFARPPTALRLFARSKVVEL